MVQIILVIYLFLIGLLSSVGLIVCFPNTQNGTIEIAECLSEDQGLMLVAALAGVMGSFLHASQSLASYLGNGTFKSSWAVWFFVRPLIGGILALAIFLVIRAGLITGSQSANPYSVAAIGLLGGWFSKTTTDKLQEVFETLFKSNADEQRIDKLK